MCLGIPMQVIETSGSAARCRTAGMERETSLFVRQDEPPVIAHLGYTIRNVVPDEALTTWERLDVTLAAESSHA